MDNNPNVGDQAKAEDLGQPDSRAASAGRPGHVESADYSAPTNTGATEPAFDTTRGGAGGLGSREGYGSYDVGPETADDPAQRAAATDFAGRGPKGYRGADERIRAEVAENMTAHPELDASDIEIEVVDGAVRLTGTVSSRAQKWLAEDCAVHVAGVVDVHDDIRLVTRP